MARAKKASPHKRKVTAKQRRATKKRLVVYFVVFLSFVIGGAVVNLLNQPQMRFEQVTIKGTQVLDPSTIRSSVEDYISGKYLGLLYKNSYLLYPQEIIEKHLFDTYPEILNVEFQNGENDDLVVIIEERTKEYYLETKIGGEQGLYQLDAQGTVFHHVNQEKQIEGTIVFSSSVYNEKAPVMGSTIEGFEDFVVFNQFLEELSTIGLDVSRVHFENSILAVLEIQNGVRIVINPIENFEAITETMREIMQYKEFGFSRREGSFTSPVVYINLRHGNKIFYCYDGEACTTNYLY